MILKTQSADNCRLAVQLVRRRSCKIGIKKKYIFLHLKWIWTKNMSHFWPFLVSTHITSLKKFCRLNPAPELQRFAWYLVGDTWYFQLGAGENCSSLEKHIKCVPAFILALQWKKKHSSWITDCWNIKRFWHLWFSNGIKFSAQYLVVLFIQYTILLLKTICDS